MYKKVAIVQSNYIPWKGYFDLINMVDEFILFDDMQFTKRDWRNRNLIKSPNGLIWLTIPVRTKGKFHQRIRETVVTNNKWRENHWKTIKINYSKSKYFADYCNVFEDLYLSCQETYLSRINYLFISKICKILGITSKITWSMDYKVGEGKTERLVNICKQANSSEYISGPSAMNYLDEDLFEKEGIQLTFIDYSGYPEYEQLYPPFEHDLSVIDLIFNTGPEFHQYLKRG